MRRLFILLAMLILSFYCFAQRVITNEYDWSPEPKWNESEIQNTESYKFLKNYILIDYIKGSDEIHYVISTNHYIVYLDDASAVDNYNKVYIPYYNGIDIINIKARTFNKSCKAIYFDRKNIKDAENLEDKGKYKLFALEGVEKGNIVEVFFTIKKPVYYYGAIPLQKTVISKNVFFQIASPKNLHFSVKVYNGKGKQCDSLTSTKRYIGYYFDEISALKEEKYSNYEASRLHIDYKFKYNDLNNKSEQYTYASAAQYIYDGIYKEWETSSKKLKKIIKQLDLDNLSVEERILKIENFVKNNYLIKDVSNVNDASSIEFILRNKSSDAIGITKFFALLLKAAAIDHQMCVTTSRSEKIIDPDFMSWIYLDSYLFYFPQTGHYLSPENYDFRYPMFPSVLMNNYGLHVKVIDVGDIKSALPEIKKIPISNANENHMNIKADVKFDENNLNAHVNLTQTFLGHSAMFIYPYYKFLDEEKQKNFVNSLFKTFAEDIDIKSYNVFNFNSDVPPQKDPFTIEAKYSSASIIERAGDNIIFKVGLLIGKQEQLYAEGDRQLEMDMNYPHILHRDLKVNIPIGYIVKGMENLVFNFKGEKMFFESNYKTEGNVINITIKEEYNNLIYPVSAYEQLRKIINAAADFNNAIIIFEKAR